MSEMVDVGNHVQEEAWKGGVGSSMCVGMEARDRGIGMSCLFRHGKGAVPLGH